MLNVNMAEEDGQKAKTKTPARPTTLRWRHTPRFAHARFLLLPPPSLVVVSSEPILLLNILWCTPVAARCGWCGVLPPSGTWATPYRAPPTPPQALPPPTLFLPPPPHFSTTHFQCVLRRSSVFGMRISCLCLSPLFMHFCFVYCCTILHFLSSHVVCGSHTHLIISLVCMFSLFPHLLPGWSPTT